MKVLMIITMALFALACYGQTQIVAVHSPATSGFSPSWAKGRPEYADTYGEQTVNCEKAIARYNRGKLSYTVWVAPDGEVFYVVYERDCGFKRVVLQRADAIAAD